MNVRRDFLLLIALTTAATGPAFGQTAAPAAVTPAAPNAASIPDFSGAWAHPGLGFGPQLSGAGPVRNKSRRRSGPSDFEQLVGDCRNPILKAEAGEVVKRLGKIYLSGWRRTGQLCLQNPVPHILNFPSGCCSSPITPSFTSTTTLCQWLNQPISPNGSVCTGRSAMKRHTGHRLPGSGWVYG